MGGGQLWGKCVMLSDGELVMASDSYGELVMESDDDDDE